MIYSFDYNTSYEPPIPLVEVNIGIIGQDSSIQVPAIVDSGADGSIIPAQIVQRLNIEPSGWVRIINLDSISRRIPIYLLKISIGSLYIGALHIGGDKTINQMILGRDVLNHFIVTLNGLANVVQISQ
jgi:predicted aspartyl protease